MAAALKRPLASRSDNAGACIARRHQLSAQLLLADTVVERGFHPTFARYARLDGKRSLTGFIQPLNEDLDLHEFMLIEYPIGCWYCEMPELNSIVFVELPEGKTFTNTKTLVKVTGTLKLNKTDPENFLYTLEGAKATAAD